MGIDRETATDIRFAWGEAELLGAGNDCSDPLECEPVLVFAHRGVLGHRYLIAGNE